MKLYTDVAKTATLTQEHRTELKSKRGFTDETIAAAGLISAGPELAQVIEQMAIDKVATVEAMITAGLLTGQTNPPQVASQWRTPAVVIPYYKGEEVEYLRAHKFGPTSVPVEVYLPERKLPAGDEVILCESEFKALAAKQLGFQAVGIPGIASFSRSRWDDLRKALGKVDRVTVCFDSEEKGNPAFPNYKPDPAKRFDTEYYAYLMGWLFRKAGGKARIATLPPNWRVNGKVDLDGALAAGHTREELEAVFAAAVNPDVYIESLPAEAQAIVLQKFSAYQDRQRLREQNGCYVWEFQTKDGVQTRVVSNFVLRLVATFDDDEGCLRMVHFIDQFGRRSKAVPITAEQMASPGQFKSWVMGRGNYIWSGAEAAMQALWKSIFKSQAGSLIRRPSQVGWVDPLWLFGNCGILADGTILTPDDEGIVFLPDGQGYRARRLTGKDGKNDVTDTRPSVWLRPTTWDLKTISARLVDSFGSFGPAVGVGWIIGSIYSDELFRLHGGYPILFLFGKRRGGKSTLARYLMAIAGLETEGASLSNTTPVAMGRFVSYYSGLPWWGDEYRNEINVTRHNSSLRSMFNRQFAGKGIKSEFGLNTVEAKATLMLSGEDTPADNALFSRCVVVPVEEQTRTGRWYQDLQRHAHEFSAGIPGLVAQAAERVPRIKTHVAEIHAYLLGQGVNDRTAVCWALPLACYLDVIGDQAAEISAWAVEQAKTAHAQSEAELDAVQFISDLVVMSRNGKLNGPASTHADFRVADGKLFLRMTDSFNKWIADGRTRGRELPKPATIVAGLADSPGFLGIRKARVPSDAAAVRCLAWELEQAKGDVLALAAICDPSYGEQED